VFFLYLRYTVIKALHQ